MGVEVGTTALWQRAAELDLARLLFVNMLDRERRRILPRSTASKGAPSGQHSSRPEIPIGSGARRSAAWSTSST
jgi:elongation factor G